jgi:hypothetical protein
MSLYNESDLDLLASKWDRIKELSEQRRAEYGLIPSVAEKKKIHDIIVSYIKEKNRKVYGGYALNLLLKFAKAEPLYKDDDLYNHDIDMYSPDPITDLKIICNNLYKAGCKYIHCAEALHKETYTIKVDSLVYCDISYVPRNIFNKMPFVKVDGINAIGSDFMTIDYLRMMTDPMTSYWRIDNDIKAFKRFYLLQIYFPFRDPEKKYDINLAKLTLPVNSIDVLENVQKFMLSKKTIIPIGFYAYNYFLKESKNKSYGLVKVPYYEMISTNYIEDAEKLINELKKNFKSEITYEEYYPFFQFTGYNTRIYHNKTLIATIYSNNHKAIPYLKVDGSKMGTFQVVLMYNLINFMYARVNEDNKNKNIIHTIISNLYDIRNYYLDSKEKKILDDTPFREFVLDVIGDTNTLQRERQIEIDRRRKNKEPISFSYVPNDETSIQPVEQTTYRFANSSGNIITNKSKLLLFNNKVEEEDTFEEIENTSVASETL